MGTGEALNTRVSGYRFLEMRLCFRPSIFQFSHCEGDVPKPAQIKAFRASTSETPYL